MQPGTAEHTAAGERAGRNLRVHREAMDMPIPSVAPAAPTAAAPHRRAGRAPDVSPVDFGTAWCAVGGERGGDIVPRWFSAFPELGIERVHLFWGLPESEHAALALDALRGVSARWLAELRALGMEGELSLKRGAPGPWLAALAALADDSLIVTGPPAWRGARSTTIDHLLAHGTRPLLLLPDLVQPPEIPLLARALIDAADDDATLPAGAERLDLAPLDPPRAVRTALRVAEDLDASLLVLPRRRRELVPLALQHGNFPLLVPAPAAG